MRRTLVLAASLLAPLPLVACGGSTEKGAPPPWAGGVSPPVPTPAAGTAPTTGAPAPGATPAATPGAPARPAVAAPATEEGSRNALLSKLKDRKWGNDDFVEGENNRDPFHPFLVDIGRGELPTPQYEIVMSKYSLDEIKLQAIVGPPTEMRRGAGGGDTHVPLRALFVDPTGMGHTVVRGNHVSKADATVFRIDGEKYQVIVKLREELGNGKAREVERVIELYQGPEAGSP